MAVRTLYQILPKLQLQASLPELDASKIVKVGYNFEWDKLVDRISALKLCRDNYPLVYSPILSPAQLSSFDTILLKENSQDTLRYLVAKGQEYNLRFVNDPAAILLTYDRLTMKTELDKVLNLEEIIEQVEKTRLKREEAGKVAAKAIRTPKQLKIRGTEAIEVRMVKISNRIRIFGID